LTKKCSGKKWRSEKKSKVTALWIQGGRQKKLAVDRSKKKRGRQQVTKKESQLLFNSVENWGNKKRKMWWFGGAGSVAGE